LFSSPKLLETNSCGFSILYSWRGHVTLTMCFHSCVLETVRIKEALSGM
jgi:hypothetical protein